MKTFNKNKEITHPSIMRCSGSETIRRGGITPYVTSRGKLGFTLVETLVAISILLMAVVAPLVLIAGNISAIFGVKDKITALFLVEDAIDFAKYKIATNFNTPQGWLTGLSPFCTGGQPCTLDSFNNTPIQPCSGACPALNFDAVTGSYNYSSGTPSKFTRTVTFAIVPQDPNQFNTIPDEIIITASVSWLDHGVAKQTTIVSHVFPWGI